MSVPKYLGEAVRRWGGYMFFLGMLGFISTFLHLLYLVSLQPPSHKPIWRLPLPTAGRNRPFCQRRGAECAVGGRGRLVLLLGPDGPEEPPAAWAGSLHVALWLLYLCFCPPSSRGNICCNRDHWNLALPLDAHGHFCPAGMWDELSEQVPPG